MQPDSTEVELKKTSDHVTELNRQRYGRGYNLFPKVHLETPNLLIFHIVTASWIDHEQIQKFVLNFGYVYVAKLKNYEPLKHCDKKNDVQKRLALDL